MSWGKQEARGTPPLMPDTLIHTPGKQLLLTAPQVAVPNHLNTYPDPTKPLRRRPGVPQAPPKAARIQWTTIARWA